MDEKYNKKLPEVHDVMRKLRSTADEYGSVLIGETWTSNVDELKDYYGAKNDELQLPMDLDDDGVQGAFRGAVSQAHRRSGMPPAIGRCT